MNLLNLLKMNIPFALGLTGFMVANVLSGVIKARKAGNFELAKLKEGTLNYLLWLLSFLIGAMACYVFTKITIAIDGSEVSLIQAVELIKKAIITAYAIKFLQNIREYNDLIKADKVKIETVKDIQINSEEAQG